MKEAERLRRRVYASRAWRTAREPVLERAGGQCEKCGKAAALEIHHREAIQLRPDLALEPDNLIALCRPCHHAITPSDRGGRPYRPCDHSPPCSGCAGKGYRDGERCSKCNGRGKGEPCDRCREAQQAVRDNKRALRELAKEAARRALARAAPSTVGPDEASALASAAEAEAKPAAERDRDAIDWI